MPIYEFRCKKCKKEFEQLSPLSWQERVFCPDCQAADLEKLISRPSSVGREADGCGGCSGGSCGSCGSH